MTASNRRPRAAAHHAWKGGRKLKKERSGDTYVLLYAPGHPRAHNNYVPEHILVVEAALGHHLRRGVEVHHVDEDTLNNAPSNLVACNDLAYHKLLHRRQRALDACGNPDWRICNYCKQHDDPARLLFVAKGGCHHRSCRAAYEFKRKRVCALAREASATKAAKRRAKPPRPALLLGHYVTVDPAVHPELVG